MKAQKPGLHPRNRHHQRYDLPALCQPILTCRATLRSIRWVSRPLILPIRRR